MWDFLKRFIFVLGVVFVKVATPFHMGFDFFFWNIYDTHQTGMRLFGRDRCICSE